MSKTIYIPAFSGGALNVLLRNNAKHLISKKSFRFYNPSKENMFSYPYMLISAHYGMKSKKTIEDEYGINFKKTLLLGDSGGFQVATGVLNLTPELRKQILEWLENNTNYAINLDIPPHVSTITKSLGIFDERLKDSVDNFEYFAKHQTGKTKFLNVLHGREIKLIQRWYEQVKRFNEDFTGGWSIGSCAQTTYNILLSLSVLFQNGEFKRLNKKENQLIHILGLSKPKDMIFLMYFTKKLNEMGLDNLSITHDSSTPQTAGVRSNYIYSYTPESFKWMQFSNQIKHETGVNYNAKLPCSCPVCKNLTLKDLYTPSVHREDSLGPMYYGILVMHNLFQIIDFKSKMQKIIDNDSKIIRDSILSIKSQNVLKIIDKMVANGGKNAISVVLKNKKILHANDDFVEQTNNKLGGLF